jgi:hypothetical protein
LDSHLQAAAIYTPEHQEEIRLILQFVSIIDKVKKMATPEEALQLHLEEHLRNASIYDLDKRQEVGKCVVEQFSSIRSRPTASTPTKGYQPNLPSPTVSPITGEGQLFAESAIVKSTPSR